MVTCAYPTAYLPARMQQRFYLFHGKISDGNENGAQTQPEQTTERGVRKALTARKDLQPCIKTMKCSKGEGT